MQRGAEQLICRFLGIALLTLLPLAATAQTLQETSNFRWHLPEDWFGGFSALEVDPTGTSLTTLSDRGTVAQAQITREKGRIIAIRLSHHASLRHRNMNRMRGISADAEGLAVAADGSIFLSFEQRHRIARLNPQTGATENIARFPDPHPFHHNNGFEALALHPDGTLHAIPEKLKSPHATLPVYRLIGKRWHASFDIPRAAPFQPVGADFDSTGILYLLERAVTMLGFRSQIRRIAFADDGLRIDTLLRSGPGRYGNLEGISVWRDADGHTRLTTISDDNFVPILFTQVVEFVLTE